VSGARCLSGGLRTLYPARRGKPTPRELGDVGCVVGAVVLVEATWKRIFRLMDVMADMINIYILQVSDSDE
jgi:hypothetical protein